MIKELFLFTESHVKWVYVVLVYQSVLLGILLFYIGKWTKNKSKVLLSTFMFITGLVFMAFLFRHTGRPLLADVFMMILPGGFLALIPLIYLYLHSFLSHEYRFEPGDIKHFIPAIVVFILNVFFISFFGNNGLSLINTANGPWHYRYLILIFFLGQFLFYTFGIINLILTEKRFYIKWNRVLNFRKPHLLLLLLLSFGLYALVLNLMVVEDTLSNDVDQVSDALPYSLAFLIITMIIGITGISLQGYERINTSIEVADLTEKVSNVIPHAENFHHSSNDANGNGNNSSLTHNRKEELISQLTQLMHQKVFTDPQCSLDLIAKKLGSNSKYVSQAINEHFGYSFTIYINKLRIEEAKTILSDSSHGRYSIDGVGKMVGFQSKSTFNTHFKKITGMTPGEYIKSLHA